MVLVRGYAFGMRDQAQLVPMLVRHAEPQAYPHDLVMGTVETYYTLWWRVLARIVPTSPEALPTAMLVIYVLTLGALFATTGWLAWRATGSARAGGWAQGMLCLAPAGMAMVDLVETDPTTRMVALPLLLLATSSMMRGRGAGAGIWSGLAFDVHPMSATHWLGLMAIAVVRQWGPPRRALVTQAVVFVGVAFPVLAWRLWVPPTQGPWDADPTWLRVVWLRSAHHVVPSSWGMMELVRLGAIAGAYALTRAWLPSSARRLFDAWALGSGLWALAGVVLVEIVPVPLVVMLQPWRASVFVLLGTVIAVGSGLATVQGPGDLPRGPLVAAVVLVVMFHLDRDGFDPLPGLAAGAASSWVWARRQPVAWPWAWPWLLGAVALAPWARPWPSCTVSTAQDPGWLEVQRWARANTPVDALFIVPPWRSGFRVESRRSIYGSYKDGTLANFDAQLAHLWVDRMQALGVPLEPSRSAEGRSWSLDDPSVRETYQHRTLEEWRALARRAPGTGPVYVVTCPPAVGRAMAFRNESCGVEALPRGGREE